MHILSAPTTSSLSNQSSALQCETLSLARIGSFIDRERFCVTAAYVSGTGRRKHLIRRERSGHGRVHSPWHLRDLVTIRGVCAMYTWLASYVHPCPTSFRLGVNAPTLFPGARRQTRFSGYENSTCSEYVLRTTYRMSYGDGFETNERNHDRHVRISSLGMLNASTTE